ncbi:ATP-binding protein [Actinoplanes sp. NBRC 101535]|uniref:ATP-binding protein n=1 Tax=Actinoplanes sp. NBRC 101535 TaxID=3032196 RepID=UPI0025521AB3|nr:ATP-binding protein [Actinoplanes sp. NBRC 101535]
MTSLRDSLRELRRRSFTGRGDEVAVFRAALGTTGVLFVHGPGGVGKSTLLDAFAQVAPDAVRVDARHFAHVPETLPVPSAGPCPVLLLDTYELLEPVDDWIRDHYLPSMPDHCLVVIAGRQPPGPRWRADPAWRVLTRVVALGNLPDADGRAYLDTQDVPEALHERLLTISRGHPLTLSMIVDAVRRGTVPDTLDDLPDVVGALLGQVIDEAPTPRHRTALELCAQMPVTTEDVLRPVIGDDTAAVFAWLRARPFVDESPYGLHPHDVVRDALNADLRWRDPDRFAELYRRKLVAVRDRILATADERERVQLVVLAVVLNGRRSPHDALRSLPPAMGAYPDGLRDGDQDPIVAMTRRWQGEQQAGLCAYWMRKCPTAFRVFRDRRGDVRGFAARLDLTERDLGADPGADTLWGYASQHSPARPGERVRAWRFFLDAEHGQGPSPSLTLFVACQMLDIMLLDDDTAWTLVGAFEDAQRWTPVMTLLDFREAGAYTIGDTTYPVYAHDWRRAGFTAWVDRLHAQQFGAPARLADADDHDPVLSENDYTEAVRSALRDLHAPELLRSSPLTGTRLVRRQSTNGRPPTEALRELLGEAASSLTPDLHRLVERTFLQPVSTQERVAVELHLSFNTYRRHRDKAVTRMAAWLWDRETAASAYT